MQQNNPSVRGNNKEHYEILQQMTTGQTGGMQIKEQQENYALEGNCRQIL